MLLYTNGCSFTYGDDLKTPNIHAWPYVLAQKLNMSLKNDAISGSSNCRIYRKTLNFLFNNESIKEQLFIIIGWSSNLRIEYYNNKPISYAWTSVNYLPLLKTYRDFNETKNTVFLNKYIESLFYYNPYILKNNLFNILNIKNIKYLFFNVFNEPFLYKEKKYIYDNYNKNQYRDYVFYDFIYRNKYPIGLTLHPLEEGHEAWANILYDYIIKNKLLEKDIT